MNLRPASKKRLLVSTILIFCKDFCQTQWILNFPCSPQGFVQLKIPLCSYCQDISEGKKGELDFVYFTSPIIPDLIT